MTKIEWASLGLPKGVSWNPIRARNATTGKTGWHCEKVSPGCEHCYAERLNMKAGDTGGACLPFKPGHRQNGDVEVYLDETTLLAPLHWKSPRGVFPCSMTDLFGSWVPDEWIDRVFAVMALCPQHRFAVLTKRCARQRAYMSDPETPWRVWEEVDKIIEYWDSGNAGFKLRCTDNNPKLFMLVSHGATRADERPWPPRNTWLGVTVEDQPRADERIPDILATPAAMRFVSVEPMLSAVDLTRIRHQLAGNSYAIMSALEADDGFGLNGSRNRLDWVICGGESGPDARPMHPDWARSLRDQCKAAGVPYFYKQNGEFASVSEVEGPGIHFTFDDGCTVRRVGKSRAGRLLDGREHSEFPEAS